MKHPEVLCNNPKLQNGNLVDEILWLCFFLYIKTMNSCKIRIICMYIYVHTHKLYIYLSFYSHLNVNYEPWTFPVVMLLLSPSEGIHFLHFHAYTFFCTSLHSPYLCPFCFFSIVCSTGLTHQYWTILHSTLTYTWNFSLMPVYTHEYLRNFCEMKYLQCTVLSVHSSWWHKTRSSHKTITEFRTDSKDGNDKSRCAELQEGKQSWNENQSHRLTNVQLHSFK